MSRLLWFFGWAGVAVWSLLCAATYGLLDVVGRIFMRNADAFSSDPNTVEGLWRMLNGLHTLSTGAVMVVWALVSLLILSVPWLLDRMVGRATGPTVVRTGQASGNLRGDVIDLTPDQYSVAPAGARDGRTVPGISPRR